MRMAGGLRHSALGLTVAVLLGSTFTATAATEGRPATSRVMVGFKAGPTAVAAARAAIAQQGGRTVIDLGEVGAVAVEIPSAAIEALRRGAGVAYVEEDLERHITTLSPLMKPSLDSEVVPYGITMVQADELTDAFAASRKLCIIDSGYDLAHEDLQDTAVTGNNLTLSGTWDSDENSHGTHVAGTVSALGSNGVGVVGVMPGGRIQLHIEKVFDASGSARSSAIIRAVLNCAAAGANVINMSLGGSGPSRTEQRTYDEVAAGGILVVASAGNDGDTSINYPAGYASVMSVAAVDEKMNPAVFSQRNADVEIAAPGVRVLSTVPPNTQLAASLTVGTSNYAAQPMEGSPVMSATGTLADFGLGGSVRRGAMTGKVCLVQRGTYTFADKVLNCQKSGGVGAVIYNNAPGEVYGTLGGTVTAIPSVGVTQDAGTELLQQIGQSATPAVYYTDDKYAAYDGTSMAAPHVAAVAALVWSHHQGCTAEEIRSSLNKSARDVHLKGKDDATGNGLVQANAASDRIERFGCGN